MGLALRIALAALVFAASPAAEAGSPATGTVYERSGAKVTEIKASHLVYISQPGAVASVIKKAARPIAENTAKPDSLAVGRRAAQR